MLHVLREIGGCFKLSSTSRGIRLAMLVMIVLLGMVCGASVLATPLPKPSAIEIPTALPRLEGSVVVTSIGQTPGGTWVQLLLSQLGIASTLDNALSATGLAAMASKQATAPKVLILVMGTSNKGMGGAGVDVSSEVARCKSLIARARQLGMSIIGGQIEGAVRRTDKGDEQSNGAVAPHSDVLIVMKDADTDGYFTKVAQQKGIPIVRIAKSLDFKYPLALLFGK